MSKETKKTKTVASATPAPEPASIDWGSYAGESGFENVSQSDLGIPFLNIIQPKSAEVDRTHKDYAIKKIEGASAGDVINSVSRQVLVKYDKGGIVVVPAGYEKTYNEWKPNRGGLVRIHRNADVLKDVTGTTEKNESVLRNGNLLIETAVFYVLLVREGEEPMPAIINMVSTGLKHARHWLNLMTGLRVGPNRVQPPMFSHTYTLTPAIESNAKGAWYGWNVAIHQTVNDRNLVNMALGITKKVTMLANVQRQALPAVAAESADEVPM
jgi:hypothetical protein